MNRTQKTTRLLPLLLALALLLWAAPVSAAEATPETAALTTVQAAPESDSELNYLNEGWAALSARARTGLPASFDLRQSGRVSAVRDQTPFGTCWTFAVMGAMESNLRTQGVTGVDLSEAQLAFFCGASLYRLESLESYLEDELNTDAFTLYSYPAARLTFGFTEGGNDDIAVGALASWVGPISEKEMPYADVLTICGEDTESDQFKEGAATLAEWWESDPALEFGAEYHLQDALYFGKGMLTDGGRDTVKRLLQECGALSIGYNSYNSDVCVNNLTATTQNHAVLLVGWDDAFSQDNFPAYCRPQNPGAWLVRNNYGTGWGDAGYFWISYEDTSLSMEPVYLMQSADNYDHNYQHDRLGWKTSLSAELNDGDATGTAYMANIFEAEGADVGELLEAVSFYTTDVNVEYAISVYTGVEAGRPTSGMLVASQSGTQPYPGYHTVRLDQPVALAHGERFSVVIKVRNPAGGYAYPIAVESARSDEKPYLLGITPSVGFVSAVAQDGSPAEWCEVVEAQQEQGVWPTAVCIKAFTSDLYGPVRFSSLSDTVAEGTTVTLHAAGADAIRYTLDGAEQTISDSSGEVTLHFGADDTVTLLAQAVYGGTLSEEFGYTYHKAAVDVVDVYGTVDGGKSRYAAKKKTENGETSYLLSLPVGATTAQLQVCGGDTVRIDDTTTLPAGTWSGEVTLDADEDGSRNRLLKVTVSKDGYNDTKFDVFLYSPGPEEYAAFDCKNETMTVRAGYRLVYEDKTILYDYPCSVDGASLADKTYGFAYSDTKELAGKELTVYRRQGGDWELVEYDGEAVTVTVPERRTLPMLQPDYAAWDGEHPVAVTAKLSGDEYDLRWADTESACTAESGYHYFVRTPPTVRPGDVLYLYLPATAEEFASPVEEFRLPAVPGAVTVTEKIGDATGDTVTLYLQPPAGELEYSADGENWYSAMLFTEEGATYTLITGLEPNQEYTVRLRVAAQSGCWPGEITEVDVITGDGYRLPYYLTYNGFRVDELTQYYLLTEGETLTVDPNWEELAEQSYVAPAGAIPAPVEVTLENGVPSVEELSCEITYLTGRMPEELTYKVSYYDENGRWLENLRFTFLTSGAVTYNMLPTPEGTVLDESRNPGDSTATRLVIDGKGRMYAETPWVKCRVKAGTAREWNPVSFQGRGQTLYNSDLTTELRSAGATSVSAVASAMSAALQTRMGDTLQTENLRVYEGIAQCVLNGKVCVDLQQLPDAAGEVIVTLRLKDAQGKPLKVDWTQYTPLVTHMNAKDENGHKAGEVEFLEVVSASADVVRVRTKSLSPLAVTWTKTPLQPTAPTAAPQPQEEPAATPAPVVKSSAIPRTGDAQAPAVWVCLLGVSAIGCAALRRKKR